MSEGTKRYFPVLRHDRYASYGCPDKVPWELVAAHEPQAYQNHGQTVQRLADRGGLDPTELVAVLQDRRWHPMGPAAASEHLLALVNRHEERVLKPVLGDPAMGVQVSRRFVPLEPGVEWKEGFTSYGFPVPRGMREENDAELAARIKELVRVGEVRPLSGERAGTGPGLYQVQHPKEYSHEQRVTLWQTVARCSTYEQALVLVSEEACKGPGYARIFCDPGEVAAALKLPR